jgi:hypothetical protein
MEHAWEGHQVEISGTPDMAGIWCLTCRTWVILVDLVYGDRDDPIEHIRVGGLDVSPLILPPRSRA